MQQRPDPTALLEALCAFLLGEVAPKLEGDKALQFRVMIAASLTQGLAAEERAVEARLLAESLRLKALFPDHPAVARLSSGARAERLAALDELDRFLSRALRAGALTADRRIAAADHLWATAKETLELTNPRFDVSEEV